MVCGDYLFIHNKNKCLDFFKFIFNGSKRIEKNSPAPQLNIELEQKICRSDNHLISQEYIFMYCLD